MSLGQAIGDAMKELGLAVDDLDIPYGDSMIRKIRSGARKPAPDIMPLLADKLNSPEVSIKAWRELTNTGPAFLDGINIELHRSSMKDRLLREFAEAVDAVRNFDTSKPPGRETDHERRSRKAHLMEVMDSLVFGYMYVAVICMEYGDSFKELHDVHFSRLKSLGLVQ
ncbi:hypothetical protein [Alicyclobacillus fastidiosus]|uniref:XRE family transcriptional regulator n=1 Tax=Alicyclobacillus fastidiosus TaxID=392011 RepID=A0ABV5AKA4_9BACL|nr:hypothetical protein [Alicyclobacillus fastidiosus]WEH09307.1 hypothetical protein PYS47_21965 [Alicyclobacillus fastidiosus]